MPDHDPRRGSLFAIGGREDRLGEMAVLERFAELCGGEAARLVVVSSASLDPEKKVAEYDRAFRSLGVEETIFLHPSNRAEADAPEHREAIERASGVFFVGGNQLKLVSELGGTRLIKHITQRFADGLHVGGTSAGASALGTVMIARGKARSAARLSTPRMSAGFGLCPGLILDQHFRERDRFGRLLAAVLCNPASLGVGLDEDTALLLEPGNRLEVFGRGSVTIVDGRRLEANEIAIAPEEAPAAFAGMRLHVLTEGWRYDPIDDRVTPPERT